MPAKKNPKNKTERDLQAEIENSAKLFDVAKPGNTPAPATSRPVIVRHASTMNKDPMMRDDSDSKNSEKAPTVPIKFHKEAVIKPPTDTDITEPAVDAAATDEKIEVPTEEPNNSVAETPVAEEKTDIEKPETIEKESENGTESPAEETNKELSPAETTETESAEEDTTDQTPSAANKNAVESLVNEVSSKKESQKQLEQREAQLVEIEKIIQSKEFFVPIGQVRRRRSGIRLALILIVLIALGGVVFLYLLDAGLIETGIQPPTDLF